MQDKTSPSGSKDGTALPADLAPETHNAEQDDEPAQAQSLADEVLGRRPDGDSLPTEASASEQAPSPGDDSGGLPDLVDHMNQMVSSGRIDMSAFRGERNDDDEDGLLGEEGREGEAPRGSS